MQTITTRKLDQREGSEGDRHDPYSWTARTVKVNGTAYTLRSGSLGYDRFIVNGKMIVESYDYGADVINEALHLFQQHTGLTIAMFDKCYSRLHRDDMEDPMGPVSWYI